MLNKKGQEGLGSTLKKVLVTIVVIFFVLIIFGPLIMKAFKNILAITELEEEKKELEEYNEALEEEIELFKESKKYFEEEEYLKAIEKSLEFIETYPVSALAENAYLQIIGAYAELKNHEKVIFFSNELLTNYEETLKNDEERLAMFHLGFAYYEKGRCSNVIEVFEEYLNRFTWQKTDVQIALVSCYLTEKECDKAEELGNEIIEETQDEVLEENLEEQLTTCRSNT